MNRELSTKIQLIRLMLVKLMLILFPTMHKTRKANEREAIKTTEEAIVEMVEIISMVEDQMADFTVKSTTSQDMDHLSATIVSIKASKVHRTNS